ncbi:MAG TPA: hypothetical protein VMT18_11675 [Planctomycetota bacterium]|nr:hypothetical protein [Planctomycetota bacterium]
MAAEHARAREGELATCFGCRHFLVRHEARWPHACELFGRRSRALPSLLVRRASGEDCRAREVRGTRATETTG